jgi:sensor domain CHASE-containing protein
MTEGLIVFLTIPLAIAVGTIFTKFIVLCQQAREEEFQLRKRAVVLASIIEAERRYIS